jgi:hypothetical protein
MSLGTFMCKHVCLCPFACNPWAMVCFIAGFWDNSYLLGMCARVAQYHSLPYCKAYMWAHGMAMVPLTTSEEQLSDKIKQVGEDFINTLFSGISPQDLKKMHLEKETAMLSHVVSQWPVLARTRFWDFAWSMLRIDCLQAAVAAFCSKRNPMTCGMYARTCRRSSRASRSWRPQSPRCTPKFQSSCACMQRGASRWAVGGSTSAE